MRIFITGGSGLLGHKLVSELAKLGHEVIATYNLGQPSLKLDSIAWVKLDLVNTGMLEHMLLLKKPEVVIHSAAYTDVDGCEARKDYAWRVNVEATRSIVKIARVIKSYIIYISTDYVFDGEKGLYKEEDLPNPVNYYGLTKLLGEEIVRSSDILYTIVRTSAIYGIGPGKPNFATFIVQRLLKNEEVKALVDQFVSPTLNTLLAKAIAELVELRPIGILHIAGNRISRYDFALRIARIFRLPEDLIKKAAMSEMKWSARRPRDSSLDTSKAKNLVRTKGVFDLDDSLKIFKEEAKNHLIL